MGKVARAIALAGVALAVLALQMCDFLNHAF
jgi:hypothetical protein